MGSSASILSTSALENATTSELLSNLLFPADEFANELVDHDKLRTKILVSNKLNGKYILDLLDSAASVDELELKLKEELTAMDITNEDSQNTIIQKVSLLYNNKNAVPNAAPKALYDVVFVLGGPGCGKGTNCARIVTDFDYTHLSAGDLLRAERESGSDLAEMINSFIKDGRIVPAEVTVGLLKTAMEKSGKQKFLVDGFPRDMSNLESWQTVMSNSANVQFLLFLDSSEETMLARLLKRGETSGRSDDNMDSIKKRFVTYEQSTRPIIDYFRKLGKVRQVDANRDFELVYVDVAEHFRS